MSEKMDRFIDYLFYQINLNKRSENIFRRIPDYLAQLEEKNKDIENMMGEFEDIRRRDIYALLVQEFTDLLNKKL